jgi:hypothetical protein
MRWAIVEHPIKGRMAIRMYEGEKVDIIKKNSPSLRVIDVVESIDRKEW